MVAVLGGSGTGGGFWSSYNASNGIHAYRLAFDGTGINPTGLTSSHYTGFSLRCLAS